MTTSDGTLFPERLTKIDELTRADHTYLSEGDECLFFGEYSARKGFSHSATNQVIFNFKKPTKHRNTPSWQYKTRTIAAVAKAFSQNLGNSLSQITLVPVPPSKLKTDPEYDDRLTTMLKLMRAPEGMRLDTRELITQIKAMPSSHGSDNRLPPSDWEAAYQIEEKLAAPPPTWIGVIDDLLVTGCRFRAMSNVLKNRFPQSRITGLFIARRVPESIDWSALFTEQP